MNDLVDQNFLQLCDEFNNDITTKEEIIYKNMSEVISRPINWLWKGLIARGKFSVIAGNPGVGKSQIIASISAIVSTGGTFPDGTNSDIGYVIILSAEDSSEDTIKPRLEAANADLTKVISIEAIKDPKVKFTGKRQFNLEKDIINLDQLLFDLKKQNKEVNLIFIDPISAYLGNVNANDNAEVRALLTPLSDLAEKYSVAVVGISHFSKGKDKSTNILMKVMGSLGFVAAARAAFLVAKDNEDESKRLFLLMKNNIGKDTGGFSFNIALKNLGGGIETTYIIWSKEPVTRSADEVMGQQGDQPDKSALEEACDFLFDILSDGPVFQKDVKLKAKDAGIADKTLYRAKSKLNILSDKVKGEMSGSWFWKFPDINTWGS